MYIYLIQRYSDILLQNDVYKIGIAPSVDDILTSEATQHSFIHIVYATEDKDAPNILDFIKQHFNENFTRITKSNITSFGDGVYKGNILKLKSEFIDAISAYSLTSKKNTIIPISETIDSIITENKPFESMSTESNGTPSYTLADIDDELDADGMTYSDGDDMLDYGVEKDIVEESLQQHTNSDADLVMNGIIESIKQQYLKEYANTDSTVSTVQTGNK